MNAHMRTHWPHCLEPPRCQQLYLGEERSAVRPSGGRGLSRGQSPKSDSLTLVTHWDSERALWESWSIWKGREVTDAGGVAT